MDVVAPVLAAVVGVLGGYIVGNWRLKYEHLHERRAEVIAELSRLLAAVQRGVGVLGQRGAANRLELAREAGRAYNELRGYYHSNEVWLDPDTCDKVESFVDNVYESLRDYLGDLDERGYPKSEKGRAAGKRISEETEPLRRELMEEFRAILYPPRWWQFWR